MIIVAGAQHRGVPLALSTTPSARNINESDLAASIGSQVLLLSSEDLSTSIECQMPDTVVKAELGDRSLKLSFLQDNNHTRTKGMYNSLFILIK